MAFGPEFICGFVAALQKIITSEGLRITRVEGGESWVALKAAGLDGDWLLLSWGAGSSGCCLAGNASITALSAAAPARTPLAEALKSRVVRGDLTGVRQLNHDRVLELSLRRRIAAGTSIGYILVLEATEPVGNFLLLNEEYIIEEVARHAAPAQNRYRTLLPGHKYVAPPPFDGVSLDKLETLTFETVQNLIGIGRPLTRFVQSHWEDRDPDKWLAALRSAINIIDIDTKSDMACFMLGKNYLTRFGLTLADNGDHNIRSLGTNIFAAASQGVLIPMLRRSQERRLHDVETQLKRAVKSKERHRDGLLKQLRDCAEAETFRRKGELLLAHLYEIPARAEKVTLSDWQGADSDTSSAAVTIVLEPNLSPSKNAERYFKKYRKARGNPTEVRAKLEAIESAIAEILEQRDLLEGVGLLDGPEKFEEAVRDVERTLTGGQWAATGDHTMNKTSDGNKGKIKGNKGGKKREEVPPHLLYEFEAEGLTILVGLSARGNRYVTFKQAHGDDLWLHAHELPGSHVIIRSVQGRAGSLRAELENEHPDILQFAAALAAGHSRGRNSALVSVDYTERRYVRAVPGTVALVTYVNPGTLRVKPILSEQRGDSFGQRGPK